MHAMHGAMMLLTGQAAEVGTRRLATHNTARFSTYWQRFKSGWGSQMSVVCDGGSKANQGQALGLHDRATERTAHLSGTAVP